MQTLKTCSIPDEYRTVCFKDLEEYLKVDDLLYGYSQLEQATIRKNLGIIN
jgi:gas vesicle protein